MFTETEHIPMTGSARDSLIAISVLWAVFAVIVGFRLAGRIRGMGLGSDDILSVVALVLSGSTIGLNAVVFTIGVGVDFDDTAPVYPKLVHNLPVIMQITFAFTLVYIWCLAALKMSQLMLYLRVFAARLSKWAYGTSAIVVAWAVTFNFLFMFLCDPIQQQWTVERVGHCMDQILLLKCLIMTNLVTDLAIVILPIWSVWQLQMRRTEKFAVIACFGLGGACVFISLSRFIQLYTIDLVGNLTGTSLTTFMLCSLELILAGLCINIPMLRPFYIRLRAKYKNPSLGSGSGLGDHKVSKSWQISEIHIRPEKDLTWLELVSRSRTTVSQVEKADDLQDDKDQSIVTGEDASSDRRFTSDQQQGGIHVRKDWTVSSVTGLHAQA
ncbi:hypothetical protein FKW77_003597 [Venturia effusa]|uniref:Rhodopsin domain-containing protein n=1 Tax=Venturia effusa TaxID=50376 RepID=A0A517L2Z6_9PEZI|nr:hypothetical protein FKW77_003597 [Venturia effusa]